jgi:hypothetical protein
VCSAPFPLFARIIFPPIFSGADLRSAALSDLMHDVERACSIGCRQSPIRKPRNEVPKVPKRDFKLLQSPTPPRSFVLVTAINVRFVFVNMIMDAVLVSDAGAGSAESVAAASRWAWESELP